jgi:hypothetical protein
VPNPNSRGAGRPLALHRLFAALLLPLFLAGQAGPDAYPGPVEVPVVRHTQEYRDSLARVDDQEDPPVDPTDAPPDAAPEAAPPPATATVDPPPAGPEAQAIITTWDGTPLPRTWPLGVPLGLSAAKSVAGTHPTKSIRWDIEPEWVDQHSRRYAGNRQVILATGVLPKTIRVTLSVAKADTFDTVQVNIDLAGDPNEPGPAPPPAPVPPPTPPTPTPTPTPGPLSAMAQQVRDLANRDIPADLPLRQGLLLGLSAIHSTMADDISKAVAGIPAYSQLNDPANIIAETTTRNRAMVGVNREAFLSFFTDLKTQVLNPLKATTLATPGGHIQVWKDIAAGLQAAAGPVPASSQAATISR